MKVHQIFSFTIVFSIVHCLPWMEHRIFGSLNSTNNLGSFANTESNATAHGAGSTVGISGIVSGDTSSTVGTTSNQPNGNHNSEITAQGNCSEFSTSSAQGSTDAEATANGNCLLNLNNTGIHQKVVIGMEGQVNSMGQGGGTEALINQTTAQNQQEGYSEAYQLVQGPQATGSFSGVMASDLGDQIVTGPSETLMSHSIGQPSATVESVINPLTDLSSLAGQLTKA